MKKSVFVLLGIALLISPSLSQKLSAGDSPPESADTKATSCGTDAGAYDHGALKNFHSHLCHINVDFPGLAEEVLYKLVVKMGMNPDLTTLAADGTATALTSKTIEGKVISGTVQKVVSPNSFATFYDYKALVALDGTTFATIYWTGKGASSKGFLILGGAGFGTKSKLLYVRWDRSTAAQSVDVLGTRLASTYLGTPATDDAIYGNVTYDTGTKATTVQVVELGRQRGATPSTTVFACWKMYAIGVAGGAMRVGKTASSSGAGVLANIGSTGQSPTSTLKDGKDNEGSLGTLYMDDWGGNDTKTEPNGSGNGTVVEGMAMNYSCNDLNSAGGSSKPFAGNTVNHSMTKGQTDTMFSATP